jgi:hypothetical protein
VEDSESIDTAWRIHAALSDWTGKVDTKASFCFAIESAALVTAVNLTSDNRLFSHRVSWDQRWSFNGGIALLVVGVLCAAFVVIPRLRRRATRREWPTNFIYFGHLRKWDPVKLEEYIKSTPLLRVLSVQLVSTSKIAWRKHLLVQLSLTLSLTAVGLLGFCIYLIKNGAT